MFLLSPASIHRLIRVFFFLSLSLFGSVCAAASNTEPGLVYFLLRSHPKIVSLFGGEKNFFF